MISQLNYERRGPIIKDYLTCLNMPEELKTKIDLNKVFPPVPIQGQLFCGFDSETVDAVFNEMLEENLQYDDLVERYNNSVYGSVEQCILFAKIMALEALNPKPRFWEEYREMNIGRVKIGKIRFEENYKSFLSIMKNDFGKDQASEWDLLTSFVISNDMIIKMLLLKRIVDIKKRNKNAFAIGLRIVEQNDNRIDKVAFLQKVLEMK